MSIDGPPFCSLDASETGEGTKVGGVNSMGMKEWNTTRTHEHFLLSPVPLASRDQDGSPSNSTINIYDLTGK